MTFSFLNDPETYRRIVVSIVIFFFTTLLSFLVGRYWGWYQARQSWKKKEFLGRIIVSLNSLTDGLLKIRTIFERSLEEVFLNPIAVEKIRRASQRTTPENPILPISKEDRWYLLNFVLNAVSERFVQGLVRFDACENLRPVTYLIFLTCEVVGEDRIRKVRAMMIRKDHLVSFPYHDSMPQLEQEWHSDRVHTLRRAAQTYRTDPDHFLSLEIYV